MPHPTSEEAASKRLRLLFAAGLVHRPQQQHVYLASFLNPPLVYALSRAGARELARRGHALDHRLDWTFREVTAAQLAHTIEVADAMLSFHVAAHQRGTLRLVDHHQLLDEFVPASTRALRDPFKLTVDTIHNRKTLTLSVVPDRLFSLIHPDATRQNFCLELDRGQMSVGTKSTRLKGKSSFRKKHMAYFHAHQQKLHTEAWAMQGFRVLTITTSDTRISNMLQAQREITNGKAPQLFLYSTPERIAELGVFGPAWITIQGEGVSIIKRTSTGANS